MKLISQRGSERKNERLDVLVILIQKSNYHGQLDRIREVSHPYPVFRYSQKQFHDVEKQSYANCGLDRPEKTDIIKGGSSPCEAKTTTTTTIFYVCKYAI